MDDFNKAFDETDVSEETVTETVADDGAGEAADPETVEAAIEEVEQVAEEMPQETAEPTTTPPVVDDNAVDGRIQAVLAERDKRQAAEKRVAELEAQQRNFEQYGQPTSYRSVQPDSSGRYIDPLRNNANRNVPQNPAVALNRPQYNNVATDYYSNRNNYLPGIAGLGLGM